jgi:hypothetical protein
MKKKHIHVNSELLIKLRNEEARIAGCPSADGYLELADQYRVLGMGKEADRILQMAEEIENSGLSPGQQAADGLLSGTANPTMLVEVVQILSRTKLSGDFVIDAEAQTFHLFFDRGHIINALSDHHSPGLDSFRHAMCVPCGAYRFVENAACDVPHLIDEGTEILLLNAIQAVDERAFIKANP